MVLPGPQRREVDLDRAGPEPPGPIAAGVDQLAPVVGTAGRAAGTHEGRRTPKPAPSARSRRERQPHHHGGQRMVPNWSERDLARLEEVNLRYAAGLVRHLLE